MFPRLVVLGCVSELAKQKLEEAASSIHHGFCFKFLLWCEPRRAVLRHQITVKHEEGTVLYQAHRTGKLHMENYCCLKLGYLKSLVRILCSPRF